MSKGNQMSERHQMSWIKHELKLLQRAYLSILALLLLLALSGLAVWSGLQEIRHQQATIERLAPLQAEDLAAVAHTYAEAPDAGYPAYYTFYSTWDAPSDAAFLAIGTRDSAPYVLRVRALGLQAQLYEGEIFNPELALPGRFDFAFVLIYLTPLFIIALMHDLISGEQQTGRLRLLASLPQGRQVWFRRTSLRFMLVLLSLIIPVLLGAVYAGTSLGALAVILAVITSYVAFWFGLSLLLIVRGWRSVTNATALMSVWVLLTLVLPTLANVAILRAVPVHQGVDLMLAQRQAVHGAWEVPREDTMQRFYAHYPEWSNSAPLPQVFHWKWYFAFHQLGDESVAPQAQAYRAGLLQRQEWSNRLGWLLPGVAAQAILHRIADTDLLAQLAYQDQIADFHRQIREFYYPYLFQDQAFGTADFAKQPTFTARVHSTSAPAHAWAMLAIAWIVLLLGLWRLKTFRIQH